MPRIRPIDLDDLFSRLPERPQPPLLATAPPAPTEPPPRPKNLAEQVRRWLADNGPAIEGQGGERRAFGVACGLVKGFNLRDYEAIEYLREWNRTCVPPFSEFELQRKVTEADREPDQQPRGYHLRRETYIGPIDLTMTDDPAPTPTHEPTNQGPVCPAPLDAPAREAGHEPTLASAEAHSAPQSEAPPAPEGEGEAAEFLLADLMARPREGRDRPVADVLHDPASLARSFSESHRPLIGRIGYRWWKGQWWRWDDRKYSPIDEDDLDAIVFWHCDAQFYRAYMAALNAAITPQEADKVKKKLVSRGLIDMVKTGLRDSGELGIASDAVEQPFWIERVREWDPRDVVPFANRLVHLPSFVAARAGNFIRKTPDYFCTYSLNYGWHHDRYTGPVEAPPDWDAFLRSAWSDDQQSIETLQEIFGYLMTPSNEHHKIFLFIGPPRCGKGTIIQVIMELLGIENIAAISFSGLSGQFGKESLVGKTAAIFPDARLSGRADVPSVVETMLAISGDDYQDVNRKHKKVVTMKLNTRFIVSSNVLPRLTETSGALVSRAIILRFTRSFLGNEDKTLRSRLIREIPAIARWAIDGWVRLKERGAFLQPESGSDLVEDMTRLASPMVSFAAESLDVHAEHEADSKSIFDIYKMWCDYHNRDYVGDLARFESDLAAAVPSLRFESRAAVDDDHRGWSRVVRGCRVKPRVAGNGRVSMGDRPFEF